MIKKIQTIQGMGVFQHFSWDTEVLDRQNQPLELSKINILYGRNYSGKTTLSKIVRAFETGNLSDKYGSPSFEILLEDSVISQVDLNTDVLNPKVFNEDFVARNFKFFFDSNKDVEPFAIVGEGNPEIIAEIDKLNEKLGSDDNDNRSGLYRDLNDRNGVFTLAKGNHRKFENDIENDLKHKASSSSNSIRNKPELFGDQNYNIRKLKDEINIVLSDDYEVLSAEDRNKSTNLIKESIKDSVHVSDLPLFDLEYLSEKVIETIKRQVGKSEKIVELLNNADIHNWVKNGLHIHREIQSECCLYCNNLISQERQEQLKKHFDEESVKLENDLSSLMDEIKSIKNEITAYKLPDSQKLYITFQDSYEVLESKFNTSKKDLSDYLTMLDALLKQRKESIFDPMEKENESYSSKSMTDTFDEIQQLLTANADYSGQLGQKQKEAKNRIRLQEVYDFAKDYRYNARKRLLQLLKTKTVNEEKKVNRKQAEIDRLKEQIRQLEIQLDDASIAAREVNELLNHNFGHSHLTLEAINEDGDQNATHFSILREGEKAYNLSEGEKSLIAFCYFIARLKENYDENDRPIIWIDDPISSLDSNHIFFMYSLIKTEIREKNVFDQLFVTTHNLNFLKYLKRLNSINEDGGNPICYLMVDRENKISTITRMPKYIKESTSEFNHLFKHISICADNRCSDKTYEYYYNFGNNARKFFEIYLYYRFPNYEEQSRKMQKFFGDDEVPNILIDRINNESSHLVGNLERGQMPVEIPEIRDAAKLIINKLKDYDENQYNALLRSVQRA